MLSITPDPRFSEKSQNWLKYALLDEPGVRSLNSFICALASSRELHEVLRLISEEVRAVLGARFVAVVIFEDQSQVFGGDVADVAALAVPLSSGGTHIGQINIYFDRPRALTHTEAQMMEVIAAVGAVTLDNAQRLQRERKRLAQAEAVNGLAPVLAAAADLDEAARRAVEGLRDLLHYDAARLLWRGKDDRLLCMAQSTASSGEGSHTWQDDDLALHALSEGTALVAGDVKHGADSLCFPFCLRSMLATPVRGTRGVLGILEVGARNPRAFDNADIITLSSLASQLGAIGERYAADRGAVQPTAASSVSDGNHDLLSVIVHDLRGPLSVVKGYASTLTRLGDSLDGEKRRRFLSGIGDAVDRLSILVDHLVGVSRIESGQYRPDLCHIDLSQLVSETVDRLRPRLGGRPVSLELPGKTLPVHVDRDLLGHAVGELLLNAARQSAKSARITVRVVRDDSLALNWNDAEGSGSTGGVTRHEREAGALPKRRGFGLVEVREDKVGELAGIGHSGSRLAFDWRDRGANGLELYVASKIIEAHGGRVWAGSELGRGNVSGFCLPLIVATGAHQV